MANILTATEAANVLRCEATDAELLALLPLVDAYIKQATGRDWAADTSIRNEAKMAARILLVRAHEDPGALAQPAPALGWGLSASLLQLEALALQLESDGVPAEALALSGTNASSDMAIGASLVLIFNHEMAADAEDQVSLQTAAGVPVAVTKTWDATKKILTVNPDADLAAATSYKLVVDHAPDVYGLTLDLEVRLSTA